MVEGSIKIRAHEVIAECRPDFGNTLDQELYPMLRPARNSLEKLRRNRRGH